MVPPVLPFPARTSSHVSCKVLDETTYPFPKHNGRMVCLDIGNLFQPTLLNGLITFSNHVSKMPGLLRNCHVKIHVS